jgi:hypothetical protein
LRFLNGLCALPLVRWLEGRAMPRRAIREAENIRLAELGIAGGARRVFDEAEGDEFTDGWRDRMAVDALLDKVLVGTWQLPVVVAAVLADFEFKAV